MNIGKEIIMINHIHVKIPNEVEYLSFISMVLIQETYRKGCPGFRNRHISTFSISRKVLSNDPSTEAFNVLEYILEYTLKGDTITVLPATKDAFYDDVKNAVEIIMSTEEFYYENRAYKLIKIDYPRHLLWKNTRYALQYK